MKKRKVRILVAIILMGIVVYVSPPIMFVKGAPILGNKCSSYNEKIGKKIYYATDFENFYILNLKFWEKLEIERLFANENHSIDIEKKLPVLYTIRHIPNENDSYSFRVKRMTSCWYFDYYANPNSPIWR